MNSQNYSLKKVGEDDCELLYSLIIEMATNEKDLDEVMSRLSFESALKEVSA